MRPLFAIAFAVSAIAGFAGTAHADSTMSSGDLIKEMNSSRTFEGNLQTGRSAAGGDGPALDSAAPADARDDNEQYLRQNPDQDAQ